MADFSSGVGGQGEARVLKFLGVLGEVSALSELCRRMAIFVVALMYMTKTRKRRPADSCATSSALEFLAYQSTSRDKFEHTRHTISGDGNSN